MVGIPSGTVDPPVIEIAANGNRSGIPSGGGLANETGRRTMWTDDRASRCAFPAGSPDGTAPGDSSSWSGRDYPPGRGPTGTTHSTTGGGSAIGTDGAPAVRGIAARSGDTRPGRLPPSRSFFATVIDIKVAAVKFFTSIATQMMHAAVGRQPEKTIELAAIRRMTRKSIAETVRR